MIQTDRRLPNVCIVTAEIVGPHRNGGLGTAMTGLVELLAANEAPVTVLYTGDLENGTIEEWQQRYAEAGAKLIWLNSVNTTRIAGLTAAFNWTKAWPLFDYLRKMHFDVIHFNDTTGEGAFCIAAKKLGLAFHDSLLCVALHSPTQWILESNKIPNTWPGYSIFLAAEKVSIAHGDLLWSPSEYLLNWVKEKGYVVPAQCLVRQYVIPTKQLFSPGKGKFELAALPPPKEDTKTKFKELVFFGRLEERKGLRLFVNILTRMNNELTSRGIEVVFMGKIQAIGGVLADAFIQSHSVNWTFPWRIETQFDQQEATAYLIEHQCLAVMASPVDNSPCTVYEALQFGIPFIAARTGGIPELMQTEGREAHLFDYSIAGLTDKLREVLENGITTARAALSAKERQNAWLDFHLNWRDYKPPHTAPDDVRAWGLMIEHTGDAKALEATLASVRRELGEEVPAIAVLGRGDYRHRDPPDAGRMIIGEFNDTSADDVLEWLKNRGVQGVVCLRSGASLTPGSGAIIRRMGGQGVAVIAPSIRLRNDGAIFPILASPVLGFLDHGPEIGGFIVTRLGLADLLERSDRKHLNRERSFLGLMDHFYSNKSEILPLPEPLISFEDAASTVAPRSGETQHIAALAAIGSDEVSQMLGIGQHYYRSYGHVREERRKRRRRLVRKYLPFLRRKSD